MNASSKEKEKKSTLPELKLTKKDRAAIRLFRYKKIRVLQKIAPHLIDESNGAILVVCSDGDQMDDIFKHHEKICLHHRKGHRPHMLSLNGGAKVIAEHSPLRIIAGQDRAQILIADIKMARSMKNIETVILYTHAPCGAAYAKGLSFCAILDLLFAGKDRIKKEIPGVKVACFCHVDYGNGKKKTYFVSRTAWLAWKIQNNATAQ